MKVAGSSRGLRLLDGHGKSIASLRAIGERANAQLKQFRVLACDFRGGTTQITLAVKAVQTLQYWTRDPFGANKSRPNRDRPSPMIVPAASR